MIRRQRWVVTAAAALTLLGGGVFAALPASADTAVTDSFENNPYDRWTEVEVAGFSLVELNNHQRARSGRNLAWLDAYPPSVHAARIYRTVTMERPPGGPVWCYGEAYLMRSNIQLTRPEATRVTLAIRAGGPDGPRLHGSTFELTPEHQEAYHRAPFATFAFHEGPITIDISVTSGTALIDDVTVTCKNDVR